MKFTLNPDKFTNNLLKKVSVKQVEATRGLLEVIKTLTPEDTGEMINSYKIISPNISNGGVDVGITNTAKSDRGFPYPHVVDKGVGKKFSYQKPKGNRGRYIGDGTHLFQRAIAAYKDSFLQIINR